MDSGVDVASFSITSGSLWLQGEVLASTVRGSIMIGAPSNDLTRWLEAVESVQHNLGKHEDQTLGQQTWFSRSRDTWVFPKNRIIP